LGFSGAASPLAWLHGQRQAVEAGAASGSAAGSASGEPRRFFSAGGFFFGSCTAGFAVLAGFSEVFSAVFSSWLSAALVPDQGRRQASEEGFSFPVDSAGRSAGSAFAGVFAALSPAGSGGDWQAASKSAAAKGTRRLEKRLLIGWEWNSTNMAACPLRRFSGGKLGSRLSWPPVESARILSDLHLGHPASPIRSAADLLPLLDGCPRVLLNGDTLETCSPLLEPASRALFAGLDGAARAAGSELVLQRGNHDPEAGWPAWSTFAGGRVLVTHGDGCFRFGSPWSPWVPRLRRRFEEIEREWAEGGNAGDLDGVLELARRWALAFHPRPRHFTGLAGRFETLWHAAWPPRTAWTILRAWIQGPRLAAAWLERHAPAAAVLVIGHTHRPGIWRFGQRWVVNTGAFHPFGRPRLVDAGPAGLAIRRVLRRDGAFAPGPLLARLVPGPGGSAWEMRGA
jgi:predicted phosphodiesterase